MSRYNRGDVVRAYISYYDTADGLFKSKVRPFVVIDVEDDTENITVACTSQIHQSQKFEGIIVDPESDIGKKMELEKKTFIYCNKVVILSDKDIIRKKGTCPIVNDIVNKLGYKYKN